MHTHSIIVLLGFPSWVVNDIYNTPVLGALVTDPAAVSIFWFMSGFLCQYQLDNTIDYKKTKYWYFWYFLNRILRLYPIFTVLILLSYFAPSDTKNNCSNFTDILISLLALDVFRGNGASCSNVGWTISVDIHGYILLIALQIVCTCTCTCTEYKFKLFKFNKGHIFQLLILFSVIFNIFICMYYKIDKPIQKIGLDRYPIEDNPFPSDLLHYKYYIDNYNIDFSRTNTSIVEGYTYTMTRDKYFYYTSILRNGASIIFGSLLQFNINTNINTETRIVLSCQSGWFYIIFGLTLFIFRLIVYYNMTGIIWNALLHRMIDVSTYCIFYVLLNKNESKMIDKIQLWLKCDVFKLLSKYTFGIYLFHAVVLYGIITIEKPIHGQLGDDNKDYNFLFLFEMFIRTFVVSVIVAIVLYYVVEYPFAKIRYNFVHCRYAKTKTKTKTN